MENSIFKSPYRFILLSGLLVYLITAYFSIGYNHPDEHFQILEFCNYKLGLSPASELPWEFNDRIRPALQPTLAYLFIKFFKLLNIENPFTHALLLRILTALLSWFVICKISLFLLKEFTTEKGKIIFLCLNFFLWFVPFLSVRFGSENYSAITFFAAIYLILLNRERASINNFQLLSAGFLLGLSFWFRFQIAFALLGLFIWLVYIQKLKWSTFFLLFSSGIVASLICLLIDFWFYGEFLFTPYNYFYSNIIEHKAAGFGTSPWWSYFTWFIIQCIPPLSIFLLYFFFIGIYKNPKHIFIFCLVPFLFCHMIVDHKELRFLFPMILCFNYLSAVGIDYYFSKEKLLKYRSVIYILILIVNIPLLLFRMFMPAQEAISYYKYMNDYKAKDKTIVISKSSTPFKLNTNYANFYKSNSIEYVVLANDEGISKYLETQSPENVLLFEKEFSNHFEHTSYNIVNTYCIYPDWILRNNTNDWQSRTKIWKIVNLKHK